MKQETKIVNAGRNAKWTNGVVNPSVTRASTVVFDTVAQMNEAVANRHNQTMVYGRRGTTTSFAFSDAMTELEGGAGCALFPSGTAAITNAIISFVKTLEKLRSLMAALSANLSIDKSFDGFSIIQSGNPCNFPFISPCVVRKLLN